MEDKHRLYLHEGRPYEGDLKSLIEFVPPAGNRTVIVMDKCETMSGVFVPESGRLNPDTGTVIYSPTLETGTRVVCPADQYGWCLDVEGWEVRVIGKVWRDVDGSEMARQTEEDAIAAILVNGEPVPFGGREAIRWDEQATSILIPERSQKPKEATVLSGEHEGWKAVLAKDAEPLSFRYRHEGKALVRASEIDMVYQAA